MMIHSKRWAIAAALVLWLAASARCAELKITSKPSGSTVFIDGTWAGKTPLTLPNVKPGKHNLKLGRFGHKTWYKTIVVADKPVVLDVTLEGIPRGTLTITSEPGEANVYLNGELEGKTPLTLDDIDAGEYEVRVHRTNYVAIVRKVDVTAGATVDEHFTLGRRSIEQVYLALIEEKPGELSSYSELGHIYLINGKIDKAAEIYGRGVDAAGARSAEREQVTRLFRELSNVYVGQFKYGDAEQRKLVRGLLAKRLEEAVEREPANRLAYTETLKLLSCSGSTVDVEALCERVVKKNPKSDIRVAMGEMYLEHGRADDAVRLLKQAAEVDPDDFIVRFRLATAYHRLGQLEEADAGYAAAAKLNPPNVSLMGLHETRARLAMSMGNHELAAESLIAAMELASVADKKDELRLAAAEVFERLGKLDEAEKLCNDALKNVKQRAKRGPLDRLTGRTAESYRQRSIREHAEKLAQSMAAKRKPDAKE